MYGSRVFTERNSMDEMKRENEALRAKLRSCSTLNTFCHETQQEIAHLNQLISSKNGIIADLRARLGKYEKTVVMEGEEPYIVGPSKSLIESLCKEICKLKQKLKESETDAAQRLETSKAEIQRLQDMLKEKEQELEMIRHRPEQEKEREIQRLRTSLVEKDRAQATRTVLCNSLAEEAEQLRAQLGATVQVCQELLGRLEKEKIKSTGPDQRDLEMRFTQTTISSDVSHLNTIIGKLQEENEQLKQRVAYVESLNSKWQKYDSSREEYVRGLCQKLKESSGLASSGPKLAQTLPAGGTTLLQQEIARLNGLLEEKMMECERLSREKDDNTRRDQERIQMLEQQVLAYVEDFKSERADRERAQGKILDLQDQVARLQLQIRTQNVQEASSSRRTHAGPKKAPQRPIDAAEPLLRNSPPDTTSKRTISNTAPLGASELQCPRCLTTYDDEHAAEYLNHWDECAKL